MRQELQRRISGKRVTIVGVGNPLRGDDGVGPALIERLRGHADATLIDASDVPENYLGMIEGANPETIVFVDAVDLGAQPGDVALIEMAQLGGARVTTHNTSLALAAQMLQADTGADIFLLAIQPGVTTLGAAMSPPVQTTLQNVARLIQELE